MIKPMRVAHVDFNFHNRNLDEIIDFYTFNPYMRNMEVILRRFVVSEEPVELHEGASRIASIDMIKGFDEVLLYSLPSQDILDQLMKKNTILKLRLTRNLKKGVSVPNCIAAVYSKVKNVPGAPNAFHVPLNRDFSFIKDHEVEVEKKLIIIYGFNADAKEVKAYVDKFNAVEKLIKTPFKVVIIGPFSKSLQNLPETGYEYVFKSDLTIGNFNKLLSETIIFVDLSEDTMGLIRQLVYRYECVYYSKLRLEEEFNHHVDTLTEEEIRKVLMVGHFREQKVHQQNKLLETEL